MKPTFDMRILIMGIVVLCALAVRPVERMRSEGLRFDQITTGSIAAKLPTLHLP